MTKVKKALKWVLALFCLLQSSGMLCMAQSETENLRKYWNYRDRFRKYFTWIGSGEGRSLVMANNNADGSDGAFYWNYYYGTSGRSIRWGDCTAQMGEYIGVLVTEYKLLKDEGNIAEAEITFYNSAISSNNSNSIPLYHPLIKPFSISFCELHKKNSVAIFTQINIFFG